MDGSGPYLAAPLLTRLARPPLDLLDRVLFLPCIFIVCTLGFSLRILGPLFLLVPVLLAVYAVLRRTMPPRLLGAFVALCLGWAALSYFQLLPASWPFVFMREAIGRQLIPMLTFFVVAWASKAYFRQQFLLGLSPREIFRAEPQLLVLCMVIAPAIMYQQGVSYQGDDPGSTIFAAYGSMINNITIAMFYLLGRMYYARDWSRALAIAYVVVVAATTHFTQFKLLTCALLAALLRLPPRPIAIATIAVLVMTYVEGMRNLLDVIANSPNFGLRLVFIEDTLRNLQDTYGLGVGYGTESVRWVYHLPGLMDFTFMPRQSEISKERLLELLSRGVHNSFAQAAFRTGVPGLVLLVCAFATALPPRNLDRQVSAHASMVFLMITIACFVNPALESPVQVVGVGFAFGYLLALRGWSNRNHVAPGRRLGNPAGAFEHSSNRASK